MLKLTENLKYLITQPHQMGNTNPAFLKLGAGFVGEDGEPDFLYKKAQGKRYNSPRNLRTLVFGDFGGLIRYHIGLGNSSDGKLFHSLKHKLTPSEEAAINFIKTHNDLSLKDLNEQLFATGIIKNRSDNILLQNGVSKRNLKFISSGGWGDNTYDFAYLEEIIIDIAWAKVIGLLDSKIDLLGAGTLLFGGQIDLAKKFPRLMHIGFGQNLDAVKDLVKSGKYKYLALEAFGNPTQVGVQRNKIGGLSFVFKTPEQVFNGFKPSREVYELDAKINEKLYTKRGQSSTVEKLVVVQGVSQDGAESLLKAFLEKPKPDKDSLTWEKFEALIKSQGILLSGSKQGQVGKTEKKHVLNALKAIMAMNSTVMHEELTQRFIAKNIIEQELKDWLIAAADTKAFYKKLKGEDNEADKLLKSFLRNSAKDSKYGKEDSFRLLINMQAKPLVESKLKLVGKDSKDIVITLLKVLLGNNFDLQKAKAARVLIASQLKEVELKNWFNDAIEVKLAFDGNTGLGAYTLEEHEKLDISVFDGKEEVPSVEGMRFKVHQKSKYFKLRTLKGFKNNQSKIIAPGKYSYSLDQWLHELLKLSADSSKDLMVDSIDILDDSIKSIVFVDTEEQNELEWFYMHYKHLLFAQLEREKQKFMREVLELTAKVKDKQAKDCEDVLRELEVKLPKGFEYIDRLEFASRLAEIQREVRKKLDSLQSRYSNILVEEGR